MDRPFCTFLALLAVVLWPGCSRRPGSASTNLGTERVIATVATNDTAEIHSIAVSADGEKAAVRYSGRLHLSAAQSARMNQDVDRWLKGQGGLGSVLLELEAHHQQDWVVVDGEAHNPVYSIWIHAFSPDGGHFGYIVFNQGREVQRRGNQTSSRARYDTYVVVDGQPQGKIYSSTTEERPIRDLQFSADSTTWSCTALVTNQKQYAVIIDGREVGFCSNRPRVRFAPAGSDYFYTTRSNNLEWVVHRKKVLGPFKSVSEPVFSSNGLVFAFTAEKTDAPPVLVVNDAEQALEYRSFNLQLSPDGQGRYWVEADKTRRRLNANGKTGKWCDDVTNIALSPDGKRAAYVARSGNSYRVVVGEETWEDHGRPRQLLWSKNGSRLACVTSGMAAKDKAMKVVKDNKPSKAYAEIGSIQLSADGARCAWVGRNEGRGVLVVDGVEQELPPAAAYRVSFSPDGQHIATVAHVAETNVVCIVDGKAHRPFEAGEDLTWTADSRHIGYVVRDNPSGKHDYIAGLRFERVAIIIDGAVARYYDTLIPSAGRRLWSNQEGELCWTGVRGTNIVAGRFK